MNFSQALEELKAGKMIKRKEWDGHWKMEKASIKKTVNHFVHTRIIVSLFKGNTLPVSPTQEDILAEDWEVIGE